MGPEKVTGSTSPYSDQITRCHDKKCPQKSTCFRWSDRDNPQAEGHISSLRAPGECRCRRCKAWIAAPMYEFVG